MEAAVCAARRAVTGAPSCFAEILEMQIRLTEAASGAALWRILEPAIRAGETYALPRGMDRDAALAYWCAPAHAVFEARQGGEIVGTYYLRANQQGGGAHVANCGYMTAPWATGRGVARAMGLHSLEQARLRGSGPCSSISS